MGIKRAVSLYSYQENFFLKKMSLEDCVAAAARSGATGIELIPEQMCWQEYLKPSDRFAGQWKDWMAKYNVESVVQDVFFDYTLFDNRVLTVKEQLDMYENNILFAVKLGFPIVRAMMNTPLNILEQMYSIGEYYGVIFGIELHSPLGMRSPYFQNVMELIDKTGTKFGGIIPDMGIYTIRPPEVVMNRVVRDGAQQKMVDLIVEGYINGVPQIETYEKVRSLGGTENDLYAVNRAYSNYHDNPDWLKEAKGKIIHIHGKVFQMNEDCEEVNIDYENVVNVLKSIDFDGFIATEYEGQRSFHDLATGNYEDDEVEQVRRHQIMLERMIK
jgi:hypothetical protein